MGANQCNVDVGFGVPVWCFQISLMFSAPSPTTCHLTSHNTDKKNIPQNNPIAEVLSMETDSQMRLLPNPVEP